MDGNSAIQESDVPDVFFELFDDSERAHAVCQILVYGSQYAEGDAFAGVVLEKHTDALSDVEDAFADVGVDVTIGETKMGLVSFVESPETGNEQLNEAIKTL